jgi:hypothetical protein
MARPKVQVLFEEGATDLFLLDVVLRIAPTTEAQDGLRTGRALKYDLLKEQPKDGQPKSDSEMDLERHKRMSSSGEGCRHKRCSGRVRQVWQSAMCE